MFTKVEAILLAPMVWLGLQNFKKIKKIKKKTKKKNKTNKFLFLFLFQL
jgi:hypothetical protein